MEDWGCDARNRSLGQRSWPPAPRRVRALRGFAASFRPTSGLQCSRTSTTPPPQPLQSGVDACPPSA
eukprot:15440402-Alexandrium_andersonii.AAC.1